MNNSQITQPQNEEQIEAIKKLAKNKLKQLAKDLKLATAASNIIAHLRHVARCC